METVLKYWPLILFALNVLALWASWTVKRGLVSRQDLDAVKEEISRNIAAAHAELHARLGNQEVRVVRLEEAVKNGPKHDDINRIYQRIDRLHGDLKEVIGGLSGIRRAVDLMNQHLLGGDR